MKTTGVLLSALMAATICFPQDDASSGWQVMPSTVLVKFFPGDMVGGRDYTVPVGYPGFAYMRAMHNYSGTGVHFAARCFNEGYRNLALTFGAGINWFYEPEGRAYPAMNSASGVGYLLGHQEFTTFPLSLGVQAVFPYDSRESLMFFGGLEGNLHFISGNLDMNQQAKAGYTVLAGFAIKIFEFGVRYSAFSDIRNLGAQLGFRFKSFDI